VPIAAKPSAGHDGPLPLQLSATSQPPLPAARHTPEVRYPFAGQVVELPSQASTASHTPADARHVVPDG
jgi:hypothetical protein